MSKVLVIVDLQKGFMSTSSEHVVQRIKSLLEADVFEHVVFTKFINAHGGPFQKIMNWHKIAQAPEVDILEEIEPFAKKVFEKNVYSSFTEEFEQYLKDNAVEEIYLAGIDTECCVLKTAVDAFEKGYKPYVLAYYCATHSESSPDFHEKGIALLKRLIGESQVIEKALSN